VGIAISSFQFLLKVYTSQKVKNNVSGEMKHVKGSLLLVACGSWL